MNLIKNISNKYREKKDIDWVKQIRKLIWIILNIYNWNKYLLVFLAGKNSYGIKYNDLVLKWLHGHVSLS